MSRKIVDFNASLALSPTMVIPVASPSKFRESDLRGEEAVISLSCYMPFLGCVRLRRLGLTN